MKNVYKPAPFLQREAQFVSFPDREAPLNINDLASYDGKIYAATDDGLYIISDNKASCIEGSLGLAISKLFAIKDKLLLSSGDTVYFYDGRLSSKQVFSKTVVDFCSDDCGNCFMITSDTLFRYDGCGFVPVIELDSSHAVAVDAYGDSNIVAADDRAVYILFGKRARWAMVSTETSELHCDKVSDVAVDRWGHIYVGTKEGAAVFDGKGYWLNHKNCKSIPNAPINKIVLSPDGRRYFCSEIGLYTTHNAKSSFIGAFLWLPSEGVNSIALVDGCNDIYVATTNGVSHITSKTMTLKEKEKYFSDYIEKYHTRESYVLQAINIDKRDMSKSRVQNSDNDGLWTGVYVLTMAHKYAVTKDEHVLDICRNSKNALLKLMSITNIPGFTARAIRRPGEGGYGNGDAEWRPAVDELGPLEWKGETSSDEMVGHFTALSAYYDFCANAEEKEEISKALCAIVDHILDNNYVLCDIDGLPTTWAHWGPHDLNNNVQWINEHGINSLELLAFLKIVIHMTGNERYEQEYKSLVSEHHYAMNCANHKVRDCHSCHIDDNLGFLITMPLLKYEDDPFLRQFIFAGLKDHWDYERIERAPFFNIVYGAFCDDVCDIELAVKSLQEMPLDFIRHNVINSKRKELEFVDIPQIYGGGKRLTEPLPYDEKPINKYDGSPFDADCYADGYQALEGTIFMLPYWIARYYGMIEE